ncbi:MAG: urea transporter [Steroidobacteraceae bacterium]
MALHFFRSHGLALLRGSGQILFQPSAVTGAVFLLLVFSQSPLAMGLCLAGLVGSTACSAILERNTTAYFEGAGGFNGALLGLAIWAFIGESWVLFPLALFGGLLTGVVRVGLLRASTLPPFTAPYVMVGWLLLPASIALIGHGDAAPAAAWESAWQGVLNSSSQVLFLAVPWIGIGTVIAVALHSLPAAVWIAAAAGLAWILAWGFGLEPSALEQGLLGYNAMILAAALQARRTSVPLALVGVAATVWLSVLALKVGILVLSAPFVVTAWMIVATGTWLSKPSPPALTRQD